jgi:hypothetical protein
MIKCVLKMYEALDSTLLGKTLTPLTKEAQEKNSRPRAGFNGAGKESE